MIEKEKKDKLVKLVERYENTFIFDRPNILVDLVDEIQKLLEFSFTIEKYPMPKIILGDDIKENDTTKSLNVDNGQIFVRLNRRSYHTQSENDVSRMFQSENVILASSPKFTKTVRIEDRDNVKKEIPIREEIFFSDNEFIFTLKTNTLKQQFQILNILERTLNIYSKKITSNFVVVSGISEIKSIQKKDKDDLETLEIYYQFRLKEISTYNDYYLLEAFRIAFGKFEEDELLYTDVVDEYKEYNKLENKKQITFLKKEKKSLFKEGYEAFDII